MKKIWIYTAGVLPLGFFAESLQASLGTPALLLIALGYLLLVRLLAERYGK